MYIDYFLSNLDILIRLLVSRLYMIYQIEICSSLMC